MAWSKFHELSLSSTAHVVTQKVGLLKKYKAWQMKQLVKRLVRAPVEFVVV